MLYISLRLLLYFAGEKGSCSCSRTVVCGNFLGVAIGDIYKSFEACFSSDIVKKYKNCNKLGINIY